MRNRHACSMALLMWAMAVILGLSRAATSLGAAAEGGTSADLAAVFSGSSPVHPSALKAMQAHLQSLSQKVIPATVAVQVGAAQGSGVVVSADGFVLTAAHVVGKPGQRATVVLHDGRPVPGKTLGLFRNMDAGLVKITADPSSQGLDQWPFAPMGELGKLKPGQWCLATGHPGGFQPSGAPAVRVGRILSINADSAITTDCTLIGGDSGGPLFDMQGNVIGIHSRIGGPLTLNLHVPVQTYRNEWERLVAGEAWGYTPGQKPYIGVQGEQIADAAKIAEVFRDAPAEKAGVRPGDVITRFADKEVKSFESLKSFVESEEPGTHVKIEVLRDKARITLELVIGHRREP